MQVGHNKNKTCEEGSKLCCIAAEFSDTLIELGTWVTSPSQ